MPPIYPPILYLDAGAGGINILNSLLLYPSSRRGALHITTRDGGSLIGAVNSTTLTGITMSDSSLPDWTTFSSGHAAVPLHLNDPHPVTLDVSGGIESFRPRGADLRRNPRGAGHLQLRFLGQKPLAVANHFHSGCGRRPCLSRGLTSVALDRPVAGVASKTT